MPQTLAILTMVFPPERRGAAFGIWGAVAGVATIAGPTLGGLLVTAFDWRYIFYINVPIGIAVLVMTPLLIPDLRTGRKHSFDVGGVVLASLGAARHLLRARRGPEVQLGHDQGDSSRFPLLAAVGVVIMAVFVWLQATSPGRRAAGALRVVQGSELCPDEPGGRVHRDRHARHLPAVLYLPSVGARLLGAQGWPNDGASFPRRHVRRAGQQAG